MAWQKVMLTQNVTRSEFRCTTNCYAVKTSNFDGNVNKFCEWFSMNQKVIRCDILEIGFHRDMLIT